MSRKILKRKDVWILGILLILILIFFGVNLISKREGKVVQVKYNNAVIEEFPLNEDITKTIEQDGNINTLVITDGKASVSEANCANQICVNSPEIDEVGETIVCLPHSLVVEVQEK